MTGDSQRTELAQRREQAAPGPSLRRGLVRATPWIFVVLIIGSWVFVLNETSERGAALLSLETWDHAFRFLQQLVGVEDPEPAYLDGAQWVEALRLAYQTLAMSVIAIGFSTIGMLLTVMLAARPSSQRVTGGRRQPLSRLISAGIRGAYVVSRAVPELIWAMLVVFVLTPGILPAAVALALHNFGILGKLCSEVVEDMDERPIRSLRTAGASRAQILLYAIFPTVLPRFLTFILYRWEVIIRATVIVGFVSAAGLGREFRLSMSFFNYSHVALLLLVYFLLVVMVDLMSAGFRRMAH